MAGESAFPSTWIVTTGTGTKLEDHDKGMTLRDYFAAKALTGLADVDWSPERIVEEAYKMADLMMLRRQK
jgi:hypothetical protein